MDGNIARVRDTINLYKSLVRKSVGRNHIIIEFKETEREDVGCMHLAQDSVQWQAVVNTVMKRRVT